MTVSRVSRTTRSKIVEENKDDKNQTKYSNWEQTFESKTHDRHDTEPLENNNDSGSDFKLTKKIYKENSTNLK